MKFTPNLPKRIARPVSRPTSQSPAFYRAPVEPDVTYYTWMGLRLTLNGVPVMKEN